MSVIILNIETATKNCSVSLSVDGVMIALKEVNDGGYSHAENLHVFIEELLQENQIEVSQLSAIAVGKGPGSYTGLRIGVSAAKGIAYALEVPLISVDTLASLAHTISVEDGKIVPMLDARRLEVYTKIFDVNYNEIVKTQAKIIDEHSFVDELKEAKLYFLGDGAAKCKEYIQSENAIFVADKYPSAKEMVGLSYQKYLKNDFEDVAYFEPFYLKDFVVTPAKKKI